MPHRTDAIWVVAAVFLLTLQHFQILDHAISSSRRTAASGSSAMQRPLCNEQQDFCPICDQQSACCNARPRRATLIVALRHDEWPSQDTFESWLAVGEELIIVAFGACGHRPPFVDVALAHVRLICAAEEMHWHAARARNLAAQLASGELLIVITVATMVAPSIATQLLASDANAHSVRASRASMRTSRSADAVGSWPTMVQGRLPRVAAERSA